MRRTIRTERLLLRPLELADAPRVSALTSEPGVARMVGMIPAPNPTICAEGWILIMRARAPLGRDHTLFALCDGQVQFAVKRQARTFVSIATAGATALGQTAKS